MSHLTSDQLIDAMDGTLGVEDGRHLETCLRCQAQLAEVSLAFAAARQIEIAEPSPLFWEHFSRRVRAAVDAEATRAGGWRRWLRWPIVAPVAGLALVVAALTVSLARAPRPLPTDVAEAPDSEFVFGDEGWALVADALGELDWDTAIAAGVSVEPGLAEQVAMELTADEQQELTALLQAELRRTKS